MNMIYRNLALQALVGVMAVSLLAAKGCTLDGDASLGDDEKPDASAGASAGKSAGTAGKSATNTEGGATLVDPGTAGKSTAQGGATLDVARTACRRAERAVCALHEKGGLKNPEILVYLNRLSDALWLMARWVETREQPLHGDSGTAIV